MTPEIGHYAVAFAFIFSLAQGAIPLWGAHKNNPLLMNFAIPASFNFSYFVAFVCLTLSFVDQTSQ